MGFRDIIFKWVFNYKPWQPLEDERENSLLKQEQDKISGGVEAENKWFNKSTKLKVLLIFKM